MDERPFGAGLRQSVQRLREAMVASGALELELHVGTTFVRLVREPGAPETPPELAAEAPPRDVMICAPAIGVFRFPVGRPLRVGEHLNADDVMGAIEVLSIAHEVHVEQAGTVLDVLVHDGEPVEYGQALLRLGPPASEG